MFHVAIEELRRSNVSVPSWELLTSRCAVKIAPSVLSSFQSA